MKSSNQIKFQDTGDIVYFICDVKELFNVDLNTPGVRKALNHAFNMSKSAVPYATGLMLKSYTIEQISQTAVRCYFDPQKILGQVRLGKEVKYYYPGVLKKYSSRFNWMDILVKKFYENLKINMETLKTKTNNNDIRFEGFDLFWLALLLLYKKKSAREIERMRRNKERKEKIEAQRKEFQRKIKERSN